MVRAPLRLALRLALLAVAAGTLSACVLGQDDVDYGLPSARYFLTYDTAAAGGCFPGGFGPVPGSVEIVPLALQGTAAQVTPFGALAPLTTSMAGTYLSDELLVQGGRSLTLSTGCQLDVVSVLSATVFSPDPELSVAYSVAFDADTVTASGPSHCQAFAGTTLDGVPFPILSSPTNGVCTWGTQGTATVAP